MVSDVFRYRAFISYSHDDSVVARRLHRHLEAYRLPAKLVGQMTPVGRVPLRVGPVYRDEDESAASQDLGAQILRALEESACLVVVCSPSAAASAWVNEEIRAFKAMGRSDRILCAIAAGEPSVSRRKANNSGCYPPALFGRDPGGKPVDATASASFDDDHTTEPSAPDLRAGASLRLAVLKIVAGLVGLRLDDLRQRDRERRMRLVAAAGLASFALCFILGWLVLDRLEARRDADRDSSAALATSRRLSAQNLAEQSQSILKGIQPLPASHGWLMAVAAHRLASGPATLAALQMAAMQARQQAAYFRVDGDVRVLEFSQDGRWVAVGFRREADPKRPDAPNFFVQLRRPEDGSAFGAPIAASCEQLLRFAPDGSHIVCSNGASLSALHILDNGLREESSSFLKLAREPEIRDAAFVVRSDRVVVVLADGSLENWDTRRLEPIGEAWRLTEGPINSLRASRDGRRLLIAFEGGLVREFDSTTRRAIGAARQFGSPPRTLGYSRDGSPVLTLENGQTTTLRDADTPTAQAWTIRVTDDWPNWRDSLDSSFRVAWGRGHLARIWHRSSSGDEFQELAQDGVVGTVTVDDERRLVAIGVADGSVRLWRVSETEPLVDWRLPRDKEVLSLALHEHRLAIAQVDGNVELFDWRRRTSLGTLRPQSPEPVRRVAFSAHGEWLATQDEEGAVTWWDSRTLMLAAPPTFAGSMLDRLRWPKPPERSKRPLAVRPIGRTVATTDGGQKILLTDGSMVASEQITLLGHDADIMALAFDTDGWRLASGGADRTARVWDVALRISVGLPLRHRGEVSALVFEPDGRYLFTASHDKFVRQWDINVDSWLATICDRVPRNLTDAAWREPSGEKLPLLAACAK